MVDECGTHVAWDAVDCIILCIIISFSFIIPLKTAHSLLLFSSLFFNVLSYPGLCSCEPLVPMPLCLCVKERERECVCNLSVAKPQCIMRHRSLPVWSDSTRLVRVKMHREKARQIKSRDEKTSCSCGECLRRCSDLGEMHDIRRLDLVFGLQRRSGLCCGLSTNYS